MQRLFILLGVTCIAVLSPAAHAANAPGSVPGWPPGVVSAQYPSAADRTSQRTLFYKPPSVPLQQVPLLVALHTWSGDYLQAEPIYAKWCIAKGWAFIHPNFRGANNVPQACGSELAVQDIVSAVEWAKTQADIDPDRIYLVGVSGGGYGAMLMAGRAPELWAGVSAWCGIYDLKAWHAFDSAPPRQSYYAKMVEGACGGAPGTSPAVDEEYRKRSASAWLGNATGVPVDLNTGIRDGHDGASVPTSQTLHAFNALAAPADRLSEADIAAITTDRRVPETLGKPPADPLYVGKKVLFRRTSGNVRVTVSDGSHEIVYGAALNWLEQQRKGHPAVWNFEPAQSVDLDAAPTAAGK